eukprot:31422-Pelagococcus_subviridis.AAC.5
MSSRRMMSAAYASHASSRFGPDARVCSSITGVNPSLFEIFFALVLAALCASLSAYSALVFTSSSLSGRGPNPAVNAASPPNALTCSNWYEPSCHCRDRIKSGIASRILHRRTGSATHTAEYTPKTIGPEAPRPPPFAPRSRGGRAA